jgi:hypothetical protein
MTIEIVDLAINSMVIVHSYVNVYQRVTTLHCIYGVDPPFSDTVGSVGPTHLQNSSSKSHLDPNTLVIQ